MLMDKSKKNCSEETQRKENTKKQEKTSPVVAPTTLLLI